MGDPSARTTQQVLDDHLNLAEIWGARVASNACSRWTWSPPSAWHNPRRTCLRRWESCAAHSSQGKLCTTRYVGRGWFVYPCPRADNKG